MKLTNQPVQFLGSTIVTQFDWGDFFLFNHNPVQEDYSDKSYEEIIPHTEATVRAVDDTYLYVYTSDPEIIKAIKDKYSVKNIQTVDKSEVPCELINILINSPCGKVNRVHPKNVNGQEINSSHYPPTEKELNL